MYLFIIIYSIFISSGFENISPFVWRIKSKMGTGASKNHSVEEQSVTDNMDRSTVVQNDSASTLADTTAIRPQIEQLKAEDEEVSEDIEQILQPFQTQNDVEQVHFLNLFTQQ